jgi:flagellar FliL protein
MASEAPTPNAEAVEQSAEPAAPSKKIAMIAALAIAGTGLGAAAGALVVAPKLIARQAGTADSTHAAAADEGGEAKGEGAAEKKVIRIDNVIVNPAGTSGTRYLMASFGLEVGDAEAEKRITDHEIEVRDRITSILETQTLASLTAPWARDSVKQKVTASIREITGSKTSLRVFVPQFVIQ